MDEISFSDPISKTEIPDFDLSPYEEPKELGYSRLDSMGSTTHANTPWWLLGIGGLLVGGGVYAAKRRARQNGQISGAEGSSESDSTSSPNCSQEIRSLFGNASTHSERKTAVSTSQPPSLADIVCSSDDQEKIADIVKTLDKNSALGLIGEQTRLEKLGQKIDSIHSLAFLWTIFHDRDLTACMQRIFAASFTKSFHIAGFMEGVNKGMSRYNPAKLDPYLQEWAQALGTTKKAVKPLIDAPFNKGKDWTALVLHLLSVKKSP